MTLEETMKAATGIAGCTTDLGICLVATAQIVQSVHLYNPYLGNTQWWRAYITDGVPNWEGEDGDPCIALCKAVEKKVANKKWSYGRNKHA